MTMTPRPSRASRSSSRAFSVAALSASVAVCSSRSVRGRLELKRIASIVADRSLKRWFSRLDVDGAELLLLLDADQGAADELEHGHEGDHGLEPVLRFEDERHELDRPASQPVLDQLQLLLESPGPPGDHQRPRGDSCQDAVESI